MLEVFLVEVIGMSVEDVVFDSALSRSSEYSEFLPSTDELLLTKNQIQQLLLFVSCKVTFLHILGC